MQSRSAFLRDTAAVIGGGLCGILLLTTSRLDWWVNTLLVGAILFVPAVRGFVSAALVAAYAGQLAAIVQHNVRLVPEWDFRVFWLHARLAVGGVNFYDREVVRAFETPLHVSPLFLELGRFWNPPQAMLFFLPLGYFDDLHRAYAAWYAVQLGALGAGVALLIRLFGGGDSAPRMARLSFLALLLALYPTSVTFGVGQTTFVVLLLLLLSWQMRRDRWGGVVLAIGVVLKPLLAVLLFDEVVKRRFRFLVGFLLAMLGLTCLSSIVFGIDLHVYYLEHGAGPLPDAMMMLPTNRSLLGAFLRAGFAYPRLLVVATAIVALVAVGFISRRTRDDRLTLAALAAAMLLLYPQTLDYYGVLLIVPVLALWRNGGWVGATLAWAIHTLAGPIPPWIRLPSIVAASVVTLAGCVYLVATAKADSTAIETNPAD